MTTNNNNKAEWITEIETYIIQTWANDDLSTLNLYYTNTVEGKPSHFKWSQSTNEPLMLVSFKPTTISMKVLLSWLQLPMVEDILFSKKSAGAEMLRATTLSTEEITIIIKTETTKE